MDRDSESLLLIKRHLAITFLRKIICRYTYSAKKKKSHYDERQINFIQFTENHGGTQDERAREATEDEAMHSVPEVQGVHLK